MLHAIRRLCYSLRMSIDARVVPLTQAHIPEVAQLLARALHEDPAYR